MRNNMSQPAQYGQRIWDDATYGTLSSDGNRVFVIEELPLGVNGRWNGGFMFGGGRNDPSNSTALPTGLSPTTCRWQAGA